MLVQDPSAIPGVALTVRGLEGVGKGLTIKPFSRIFHPANYFRADHSESLLGRFNSHLATACLVFADESFFAGTRRDAGVLKGLITEQEGGMEMKGRENVSVRRYISMFISSNEAWVVPASIGARRFTVFDVNDKHKGDTVYFKALETQMQNGGDAALMAYLQQQNLKLLPNPRVRIFTDALSAQIREGLEAEYQWWYGLMENETVTVMHSFGHNGPERVEHDWIGKLTLPSTELVESYKSFLRTSKHSRVVNRNPDYVMRTIAKYCCPSLKEGQRMGNSRQWDFPDIAVARKEFDDFLRK